MIDEAIAVVVGDIVRAEVRTAIAELADTLLAVRPLAYTTAQAARALAVSPRTIDRLVADGSLPTVEALGKCRRIPVAAVQRLAEAA